MICREFNCLFVHVPKTGGQSVEQFFMNRLGLDWEKDREGVLLNNNPDTSRGTQKLAHMTAAEYIQLGYVEAEEFGRLFKFAFVRDPYQRIVSEYLYRNYFKHHSFRDFVLNHMPGPGWDDQYRHIMSQYEMLHDEEGRLMVDFVGRFESLQADFSIACGHLGIDETQLPHRNKSSKRSRRLKRRVRNLVYRNGENDKSDYREFFDEDSLKAVTEHYRKDFEAFGYSPLI